MPGLGQEGDFKAEAQEATPASLHAAGASSDARAAAPHAPAAAREQEAQGIKVIGAGLSKTGTRSLANALDLLGYRTFSSGWAADNWFEFRVMWRDSVMFGKPLDLHMVTGLGCNATVDEPLSIGYKEIMLRYPAAKAILTTRDDPLKWYRSMVAEFRKWNSQWHRENVYFQWFHGIRGFWQQHHLGKDCDIMAVPQTQEIANRCIGAYLRHLEEVKYFVPEEKLLVFNVKDGWQPLCRFLGVPVPEAPFPQANVGAPTARASLEL